MKREEDEEVSV